MPLLIHPLVTKIPRFFKPTDVMHTIQNNQNIFVQGMAATPTFLLDLLTEWSISKKLSNVNVYHMHIDGDCPYIQPQAHPHIRCKTFFVSPNLRQAIQEGHAEYVPMLMGDIPRLFRKGILRLDTALIQVSPPDTHGVCSMGPSVEASLSAIQHAKQVICQINRNVPRTQGDALVHITHFDAIVEHDSPIHLMPLKTPRPEDMEIGRLIATHLIGDGDTLQIGTGNIPNMVLKQLTSHQNLGIHSEMFSDGVVELVKKGVITNAKKTLDPGRLVVSFLMGSHQLFEFVHNNAQVEMRDVAYTNNPYIIMKQDNMVAINSAIEVDLTGQVCSDSIGTIIHSGIGGQLDFMYGASLSDNGKAIIALHSRTSKQEPRIVPTLHQGGGVVTTRGHVNYIVTEYGIASLCGKSLNERARDLIKIAHPEDRLMLTMEARKRNLL